MDSNLETVSQIKSTVIDLAMVPDYIPPGGEINQAVLEMFRGRNIVIPFPHRDVRILGTAA